MKSQPETEKRKVSWVYLGSHLRQGRYSFDLLLEGRLWLLLVLDVVLLVGGLIEVLVAGGGIGEVYLRIVVIPALVIGLPAMSVVVDLERRAGSLDLALAVPSTERYFLRRLLTVGGLLLLQGWLGLLSAADGWDLGRALAQSVGLMIFLGALTLFWAVRLGSGGAVLVASAVSVGLLSRWVLFSPGISRSGPTPHRWLGIPEPVLEWTWNALVLALAAAILFQYARHRLRRPETMLA